MRIVVLDGHTLNPGDNPWTPVQRLGEVTIHEHTPDDQVVAQASGFDAIVANKSALPAETIARLPTLKFITITATGYNIIDIEAAGRRSIPVSNVPDYATDSVAQFTFALLLELCHRIGLHDAAVRAGEWQACRDFSFWKTRQVELSGKTLGIIGFGRIGRRVGELAHALGMSVLASNPSPKPAPSYAPFSFATVEQIFADSDVISLHCPLTATNAGMVDAAMLARMKSSAFLINTARGQLIVEKDLADALNAGALAGAAIDVVAREPIDPANPLLRARNILVTPHMAWAALEPRQRVMQTTAANIEAFLRGSPIHVVNRMFLKRTSE